MSIRGKAWIIFIFFAVLGACDYHLSLQDEGDGTCDYSSCNTREPHIAVLEVKFTRTPEQRSPRIFLLSGRFEEGNYIDTISTDTVPAYRSYVLIPVDVDHYYTVVGEYLRADDTIYAIDGAYVSKSFYYLCDSVCWEIKGNKLNIKLKK